MSQIRVFRGPAQIIAILHRGVIEIYYNTTRGGGLPDLLQYYKGEGGVSRYPKFLLRNIWTAPNTSAEIVFYHPRQGLGN